MRGVLRGKGARITLRAPELISISESKIRLAYWVDIGLIIGRDNLAISIIDPGLAVQGLRFDHPGWGPRLDVPQTEMLEDLSASGGSFL
jgi:hypothetical protein